MKKTLFSLLVVLVFVLTGCKSSSSPEAVMQDFVQALNNYIEGVQKANSADDVAKVIDRYAADLKTLAPRFKALAEKYPALKQQKPENLPPELQKYVKQVEEIGPKMMGIFPKLMQYGSDPKVIEANKRLQEASEEMNK